ncbi:hypothetical protein [Bacillus cereus]|uniref:hypothetical protein n=1 Tax=Bacillus cereus group TaxID=86661 RepID=UPI000BF7A99E|nr:hypothetical protein [Bacillus cereus]PEY47888.1 hypothetical protein CN348_24285 [Bacillus cereus]
MNCSNEFERLLKQTYNTKHVQYVPHAFLGILQEVIYNYELDGKQKVPIKAITKCLKSAVEHSNKKEGPLN